MPTTIDPNLTASLNTYGLRLQIEYKDINDVDTRVEIYQLGYTGDATYRDYANGETACEIKWGDSSTKKMPIVYGSQVTLMFDAEADAEFEDFFSSNSRKTKILIYKNDELLHVSFAEADSWTESLAAAPYEVTLTGYDGLGSDLLGDEDFLDSDKNYYEGSYTPLDILTLCLAKTGLNLEINTAVSFRPSGEYPTADALSQYKKDLVTYRGKTCYEVLEALFKGCRIYQRSGQWFCVSNDVLESENIVCYHYASDGTADGTLSFNAEFSGFWFEGEGEKNYLPALKQMGIAQDFGLKPNLLGNSDFSGISNNEIECWEKIGSAATEARNYDDDSKYVIVKDRQMPEQSYQLSEGIYQEFDVPESSAAAYMKLSLKYACLGAYGKGARLFVCVRHTTTAGVVRYLNLFEPEGDGEENWRWEMSSVQRVISMGYTGPADIASGNKVAAFPFSEIADHFSTFSAVEKTGTMPAGTMRITLFVPFSSESQILGSCWTNVKITFVDEGEDNFAGEKEITLINDAGNNYVPDDTGFINGDLPDAPNKSTLYQNGFHLVSNGSATELWKLDGSSETYTYVELISRLIASEMQYARQYYKVALADVYPGLAMVFVDETNSNKRFLEAGITYNDRMCRIEGRYVEIKERNLAAFSMTETLSYASTSGTTSPGGSGGVAAVDEKVALAGSDFVKSTLAGYLSSQYFEVTYDDETGTGLISPINAWVFGEVPEGDIDGSNTSFTLASKPVESALLLFCNGQRMTANEDYTVEGYAIIFTTAPYAGDKLIADYIRDLTA